MKNALTIVSLRWALTFAALRKSVWQTIGYVLGLLAALGAIVGLGFLFYTMGHLPSAFPVPMVGISLLRAIVVIAGSFTGILWMIIPLTLTGEGSSLSPSRFSLYGIADRKLTLGILLSALLGTPALTALISLLLLIMAYRDLGIGVMLTGVLSAVLTVLVIVSLSKAVIALAGTLVKSKRGQMFLYVIVIGLMVGLFQLPSIFSDSASQNSFSLLLTLPPLMAISNVFSWTPWGAAVHLPFDVLTASPGNFIAHVLISVVTIVVAFMVSTWALRRERLTTGESHVHSAKGLGWIGRTADSVSGAISGRVAQYWQRDARFTVGLIIPIIVGIVMLVRAGQVAELAWVTPFMMGLIYPMFESNNLAYDSKGFRLHVLAGVSGRNDRLGRARIPIIITVAYTLVSVIAAIWVANSFASYFGTQLAVGMTGAAVGFSIASIGLAEVLSTVFIVPVPSIDKPFSSPQGRAAAQGFFPMVQMLGSLVVFAPTVVLFIVLLVKGMTPLFWLAGLVGLVNGAAILVAGVLLGGAILDKRMLRVVATLDRYASLQK